jgi:hypothetical protein
VASVPEAAAAQDDVFFTCEGGEAFLRDLPRAEMHRLESGHFAVEDCLRTIVDKMLAFYARKGKTSPIRR